MQNKVLINIDVPDIEQAINFYTSAFNLEVGRRFDSQFVEIIGLPAPIYLLENKEGSFPFPHASTGRTYSRHWSPIHLDFVVDSIEESRKKALAAGAKSESAIKSEPYGKLATFSDPFGHGFCLIEFEGQGYEELRKGTKEEM